MEMNGNHPSDIDRYNTYEFSPQILNADNRKKIYQTTKKKDKK